jgi:hypothetical protein
MSETARESSHDVMGGPNAPTDVLTGGVQPADVDSDVMSSGADRSTDMLASGGEPATTSHRTMGGDAADTGSDVLADEGEGLETPAAS